MSCREPDDLGFTSVMLGEATSRDETPESSTAVPEVEGGGSSFSALGGSEVVEAVKLAIADFGGQEVTAEPPRPLTMEGMPDGESAPAGTIGYYAPDGVVVLYYTDVGRYNGIVRLGRIDGDISILKGWDEARPVTIERAD